MGECGLDRLIETSFSLQEKVFVRQIQLANELAKPLIIHCVRAHREVLFHLEEQKVNVPVIFHGFNNNYETAVSVLQKGYYLSFGHTLMNPSVQSYFAKLPANRILMETDDKEISIESVYSMAASLRSTSLGEWQRQVYQNGCQIFPKLPPL